MLAGAVAAVLVVCAVAAAGLAAWNVQVIRGASGPARAAAEQFWTDVVADDPAAAYGRLCAHTRQRWSREEFVARLSIPPKITRFVVVRVRVVTRAGRQQATVTTRLTRQSGLVREHPLPVVREQDDWRVCGDPL